MEWLDRFQYWDEENEDWVRLNPIQKHDINLQIQKDYGFLQWEQGSGKTAAAIAVGQYRMEHQKAHSTWVVSSAISIRNNWNVVLKGAGIRHVFVERLADFQKVQPGDFVLMTLNKAGQFRKADPQISETDRPQDPVCPGRERQYRQSDHAPGDLHTGLLPALPVQAADHRHQHTEQHLGICSATGTALQQFHQHDLLVYDSLPLFPEQRHGG